MVYDICFHDENPRRTTSCCLPSKKVTEKFIYAPRGVTYRTAARRCVQRESMVRFFEFKRFRKTAYDTEDNVESEDEYVELNSDAARAGDASKVIVRPFNLEDFQDIKPVLDALREGYTIALVNIRPLKDKDLVELKRAINKLKKTCDAVEGDIAGFGEDYIVITPSFAKIYRAPDAAPVAGKDAQIQMDEE